MKPPRHSKQHMRCPHDGCRKRFKGQVGDVCPACDKPAKADAWANSKPWRSQLCYCDGPWWSIKAPHKSGTGACRYRRQDDEQ